MEKEVIDIMIDATTMQVKAIEVNAVEPRIFYTLRQSRYEDSGDSKKRRKWDGTKVYKGRIETLWEEKRHGYSGMIRVL